TLCVYTTLFRALYIRLMVFVCACVFCKRTILREGGGALTCPGPGARGLLIRPCTHFTRTHTHTLHTSQEHTHTHYTLHKNTHTHYTLHKNTHTHITHCRVPSHL